MLGMIEDPVCGMQINIDTAPAQTVVDGEIYYFCSEGCKEAFERNPARYLFPENEDGKTSPGL
jgi:YHS domain-containing protein